ncbi:MAG: c-type cytochrome [Pseudanabaenaceae cyanobacterium bins.68]|nr:c-type cytochrome [Pseudanabaenaceae cyanobacterium bins.68]
MIVWFGGGLAIAADLENGAKLFGANCAACHALGSNRVVAAKTLKKAALEKYDMYAVEKIAYQVTKGKNAMPAFGKKLDPQQIEDIASYVLARADAGWSK